MTRMMQLLACLSLPIAAQQAHAAGITYLECQSGNGVNGPRILKLAANEEQGTVTYQIPANGNSWVYHAIFSADNVVFHTVSATDTLSRTDLSLLEDWGGGSVIHGQCTIAPEAPRKF